AAPARERPHPREALVGYLPREADVERQAERLRDLLVEEPAERAVRGVDAADELLHAQPDRQRVVAVARPWRPRRTLPRHHAGDVVEVAELLVGQLLVEQDEAGFVAEELAYGDGALAVLREVGPAAGDGRVVVEPPPRVGHGQRHRRKPLRRGVDDDHRVLLPGLVA